MELQNSLLEKLNDPTFPEIVRTKDLMVGIKYKINKIGIVNTKYGEKVVLYLDIGTYYLPPRYDRIFKEGGKIEDFDCELLYFTFDGRRDDDLKSPILSFGNILELDAQEQEQKQE